MALPTYAGSILQDKVAIVAGGARGIGRAYARGLAGAGAAVLVADLLEDEGRETAKSIEADGGRAEFVTVDVTDIASTEAMAAAAVRSFGGIDILVNNAAVFAGLSQVALTELPLERWTRVMDVNVKGVWLCTRAAVPHMEQRGGGAIVNQSSIAAYGGHGGPFVDYATSKAAVIGFTKSAAKELGPRNIRVNCICPGGVASEAALGFTGGDISLIENAAKQTQLISEMIRPDDMAGPLLFLVSEASKFMTGQTVVFDGGRYFVG
ncbi:MAG: glucose 1-dehydrogenase [Acidimicrobiaceae bacterium]|nr:glucose 1-dehydrogenase [Acidimicrobiaceae bacterium]